MGMPVNNGTQKPVIRQVTGEGTLGLVDRGDWSTQDDGREHLDRVAVQWFREHLPLNSGAWESVSPGIPGQRGDWDFKHPAESQLTLGLGPENEGRRFRALVAVGYGPARYEDGTYVEWGHLRSVHTGELAYSDPITVQPWTTRPPDPPLVDTAANLRDALQRLGSSVQTWKLTARYQRPDGPKWLSRQRQTVMHRIGTLPQDADTLDVINSVLDVLEDERR